ncbi:glycosyltransferase [Candidatus Parcubacteria bacterium]|nr:glycosyltransferase [Candidatus Parcubacteria bacterium]
MHYNSLMENKKNNNAFVSVVMATCNGERFLSLAVESILKQTFKEFEFLIVNDYSTDKTSDLLKEFALKDERIKVIENTENLGLTKSLNKALKEAKGKYIARMDDDDISLEERLQKQFDFMEAHSDFALIGSLADIIDETGKVIGEKKLALDYKALKKKLLFNNQLVHSSWFLRSSVLKEVGFYSEEFKKAQDYELLLRIAAKHPVCNLPEKLIQWRKRGDSLSFKDNLQQKYALKARWLAITKYGYPKLKGLFYIVVRLVWLLIPLKLKKGIKGEI